MDAPVLSAETASKFRPVRWNDAAILQAVGQSPDAVRRTLQLYQQADPDSDEPSVMAIYQWVSRQHIADPWRPRLLYCALRMNRLTIAQALTFEKKRRK